MEQAELAMQSSSPIIRWRKAHPEKAYTEEDPVRVTWRRVKEAVGDVDEVIVAASTVLLLLRRA